MKRSKDVSLWFSMNNDFISIMKFIYEKAKYDFNIIYKIRNNIVHSGDSNNEYLGYYCIRLKETLDLILEVVMHELQYDGRKTISEILGIQKIKFELYQEQIMNGNFSLI